MNFRNVTTILGALGLLQGCIAFGYGEREDLSSAGDAGIARDGIDPPGRGNQSSPEDGGLGPDTGVADAGDDTIDGAAGEGSDTPEPSAPVDGTRLSLPYDGELTSICYAPSECNGDDLVCFGALETAPGLCTEDCAADTDCSAIDGLAGTCTNGLCLVNCAGPEGQGGGACPEHMECRQLLTDDVVGALTPVFVDLLDPNFWCVYPVDAGSNDVALRGKCDPDHGDGDCRGSLACHAPASHAYPSGQCTERCEQASDCSVPGSVTSKAVCAGNVCELDCSAPGATCPSGMNCRDSDPNPWATSYRCLYID